MAAVIPKFGFVISGRDGQMNILSIASIQQMAVSNVQVNDIVVLQEDALLSCK